VKCGPPVLDRELQQLNLDDTIVVDRHIEAAHHARWIRRLTDKRLIWCHNNDRLTAVHAGDKTDLATKRCSEQRSNFIESDKASIDHGRRGQLIGCAADCDIYIQYLSTQRCDAEKLLPWRWRSCIGTSNRSNRSRVLRQQLLGNLSLKQTSVKRLVGTTASDSKRDRGSK